MYSCAIQVGDQFGQVAELAEPVALGVRPLTVADPFDQKVEDSRSKPQAQNFVLAAFFVPRKTRPLTTTKERNKHGLPNLFS